MNWTEIEAKWAAMTRRVQSDRAQGDDNLTPIAAPEQPPMPRDEASELRASVPLDRPAT